MAPRRRIAAQEPAARGAQVTNRSTGTEGSASTRTALLAAAEELFAELGYDGVGIRDIAARAGTNVSSIKYHFGSKRALYLETIRSLLQSPEIEASWAAFRSLPSTRPGAARMLVDFVRGALAQASAGGRPTHSVRLMLREALRPGEDFEFIVKRFSEPYERLMIDLVKVVCPGQDEVAYVTCGRSIFAQVLHYFIWLPFLQQSSLGRLGTDLSMDDAAEHVVAFTLRGLGCSKKLVDRLMGPRPDSSSPR